MRTAGELKVVDGRVEGIANSSGHYRPDFKSLQHAVDWLEAKGAPTSQIFREAW